MNWRATLVCLGVLLGIQPLPAAQMDPQPKDGTLSVAEGQVQGKELARRFLEQRPPSDSLVTGKLRIQDPNGKRTDLALRIETSVTTTNWQIIYEIVPATATTTNRQKLTVTRGNIDGTTYEIMDNGQPRTLTGNAAMVPFAGSDFYAADLGLEFLGWPGQRVLKKELRKDLSCSVLESTNPSPTDGPYSRVVSWIKLDDDIAAVVHADAYDRKGEKLKEFDPTKVGKVNGEWQLQEMEMDNVPAGSWTRIIFNPAKN